MAYTKTNWENSPSTNTPINNDNLNKIENGIYENSLKADQVGTLTNLETTAKTDLVSAINENTENISKIGKLLWSGSFTSGSITVPEYSNYGVFIFILNIDGAVVACIGTQSYGLGGVGVYSTYTSQVFSYRVGVEGNTLIINNENKGGSNGSQNVPITQIYGLL